MIINWINSLRECHHDKLTPDMECGYCPDCGEFIEMKWYMTRCSCCNLKRKSYSNFNDVIKPSEKYCPNCGSSEFYLEEIDDINFVDINFAVLKKIKVDSKIHNFRNQLWVDEKENEPQKLLGKTG